MSELRLVTTTSPRQGEVLLEIDRWDAALRVFVWPPSGRQPYKAHIFDYCGYRCEGHETFIVPRDVTRRYDDALHAFRALIEWFETRESDGAELVLRVDVSDVGLEAVLGGKPNPRWDYVELRYARHRLLRYVVVFASDGQRTIRSNETSDVRYDALTERYHRAMTATQEIVVDGLQGWYADGTLHDLCLPGWHVTEQRNDTCQFVGPMGGRAMQLQRLRDHELNASVLCGPDRHGSGGEWLSDAWPRWPYAYAQLYSLYMALAPLRVENVAPHRVTPYVVLWILDWLPGYARRWPLCDKVECLEALDASLRRLYQRREERLTIEE